MKNTNSSASPSLRAAIKELCEDQKEIFVISLCTTDGFSILSFAAKALNTESDKLAAMSSTIASLSDSSAKQLLDDQFDVTTIESDSGNALFVKTNYLSKPCVLTVVAKKKMSLATARYKTKSIAEVISAFTE